MVILYVTFCSQFLIYGDNCKKKVLNKKLLSKIIRIFVRPWIGRIVDSMHSLVLDRTQVEMLENV